MKSNKSNKSKSNTSNKPVKAAQMGCRVPGTALVTGMTDPFWIVAGIIAVISILILVL